MPMLSRSSKSFASHDSTEIQNAATRPVRPTPAGFPSRPRRGKWDSARTVHAPSGLPIASRKNGVPPSRPADPREPPRPPIPTVAPVLPFSLSGASRADGAPPPPPLARTEIRRGRTTPTASRADGEAAARAGGARGLLHPSAGSSTAPAPSAAAIWRTCGMNLMMVANMALVWLVAPHILICLVAK